MNNNNTLVFVFAAADANNGIFDDDDLMTMKKVHFTHSFWMLLRLKFRFNCKDLINISRKNRSRGRKHVINHTFKRKKFTRSAERHSAHTHA